MPESLVLSQQSKKQREHDADNQARRHRKIEPEVFALDPDISRQPPKPGQLPTEREQDPNHNQSNPNNNQSFADVIHG